MSSSFSAMTKPTPANHATTVESFFIIGPQFIPGSLLPLRDSRIGQTISPLPHLNGHPYCAPRRNRTVLIVWNITSRSRPIEAFLM